MKPFSNVARIPRPRFPRAEDGLRAVVERAPQAEAFAASSIERLRPAAMRLYALRRRIATVCVFIFAGLLMVHIMLGANGMVIYKQKRAEYESLKLQIDHVQQENDRYAQQIQGLKSDEKSIEKEAREQMGYARPGEVIYVKPQPKRQPEPSRSTKK